MDLPSMCGNLNTPASSYPMSLKKCLTLIDRSPSFTGLGVFSSSKKRNGLQTEARTWEEHSCWGVAFKFLQNRSTCSKKGSTEELVRQNMPSRLQTSWPRTEANSFLTMSESSLTLSLGKIKKRKRKSTKSS